MRYFCRGPSIHHSWDIFAGDLSNMYIHHSCDIFAGDLPYTYSTYTIPGIFLSPAKISHFMLLSINNITA
jgi:hypothetical protein